jgi:hypothetical protein
VGTIHRWHALASANRDPLLGLARLAFEAVGWVAVLVVYAVVLIVGALGVVRWAWGVA